MTPNSRNVPRRPIETPKGPFKGVGEAARALGMSRQAVWNRCARGSEGWKFLGPDPFAASTPTPTPPAPDWLTWNVEEAAE